MEIQRANIILYCSKWDETVDFYQNKLKLPVCVSLVWFIEFKINEMTCLSIADEKKTIMKSSRGKGHVITLKVEEIQKIYLELKNTGLNPSEIREHSWGAQVINIFDPEGNRIEFWSDHH